MVEVSLPKPAYIFNSFPRFSKDPQRHISTLPHSPASNASSSHLPDIDAAKPHLERLLGSRPSRRCGVPPRRQLENSLTRKLFLTPSYGNNCQEPIACDFARPFPALPCFVNWSSPSCQFASASGKSVVSSSYSQSAAFAALASYSPSSGGAI